MARMCPKCGGSGRDMQDNICTRCPDGRLLQAQEMAKEKAAEALKKEKEEKRKKAKELKPVEPKTSPGLDVSEGDWVRIHDCIGIVYDVSGHKIFFNGIRWANSGTDATKQKAWVSGVGVKPLPIDEQDKIDAAKVIEAMEHLARYKQRQREIDAALDAKDFDRLKELTKGKEQEQ